MHFHLPKPLHGWREFAGEVGIIVIGVLIALTAEQGVQAWHDRREAGLTRQALSDEIAISTADAEERVALEDCLRNRIGELTAKLNATDGKWAANPMKLGVARVSARIRPIMPLAYRSPSRSWTEDAWQAAKSTGMLDKLSRDEVESYGQAYAAIDGLRASQDEEDALEPKLSFLSFDQQLDNASRINALVTVGQLDAVNADMALASRYLVKGTKALHLHFDRVQVAKYIDAAFVAQRQLRGPCVKPMRLEF